jgi:hypothetical protein
MIAMRTLRTEITIHAPAEKVWEVLTGFLYYPLWNPFIREIRGNAEKGGRIILNTRLSGLPGLVFRATVRDLQPPVRLGWHAVFFFKGMFEALHHFEIQPLDAQTSRVVHVEEFSGWMVGPVLLLLEKRLTDAYLAMNGALKNHAEKACRAS